jgi:hypothetical protein
MKAYTFDSEGYFVGIVDAPECPIEPGVYLLPQNSTLTPTAAVTPGTVNKWDGGQWNIVEAKQQTTVREQYTDDELIDKLWQACRTYQDARLDASGLVGMAFKAQQGGVKALANVQWVQALWAIYYERKATVVADADAIVSLEFTEAGDLPFEYAEAFNEITA